MPITIDGPNLLVTLESGAGSPFFGTKSSSVQLDLYSFWKEWMLLSDNAKFPQLFRTIGGDALGGGLEAGDYYFLQNQYVSSGSPTQLGWRIKPPEEDIVYTLVGNLFAEDPALDIFSATDGNFNTQIRLQTSSLTQTVITDQMNTIEAKIDIVDTTVDEILIDTNATLGIVIGIDSTVNTIDTTTTLTKAAVDLMQLDVTQILNIVDDIVKYHTNRTLIDETAFTLTVYEDDNVTPHRIFDLKDENGVASITSIFERFPAITSPFGNEFSVEFD